MTPFQQAVAVIVEQATKTLIEEIAKLKLAQQSAGLSEEDRTTLAKAKQLIADIEGTSSQTITINPIAVGEPNGIQMEPIQQ